MKLIEQLQARQAAEESYFRAYLLKEDITRLERLLEMAGSSPDFEAFRKQGFYAGWSADDMRTHELKETLEPFLEAFHAVACAKAPTPQQEATLAEAWAALDAQRIDRLVGCLSRVPKPAG